MKVMYKSKEIANTTKNYNELLNKPYINSVELVGNITSGDLNIYNQYEIDNLLASARSVKVVTVLPTPTIKNTMYYVGPQFDGTYHVYLFDSDNQKIDLGTSSIAQYKPGAGINIDSNNIITTKSGDFITYDSEGKFTVLIDNDSIIKDSEGRLSAVAKNLKAGEAIEVDSEGAINVMYDNSSIIINSEGELRSSHPITVSTTDPTGGNDGDIGIKLN